MLGLQHDNSGCPILATARVGNQAYVVHSWPASTEPNSRAYPSPKTSGTTPSPQSPPPESKTPPNSAPTSPRPRRPGPSTESESKPVAPQHTMDRAHAPKTPVSPTAPC